jgi:hypothetical protein
MASSETSSRLPIDSEAAMGENRTQKWSSRGKNANFQQTGGVAIFRTIHTMHSCDLMRWRKAVA